MTDEHLTLLACQILNLRKLNVQSNNHRGLDGYHHAEVASFFMFLERLVRLHATELHGDFTCTGLKLALKKLREAECPQAPELTDAVIELTRKLRNDVMHGNDLTVPEMRLRYDVVARHFDLYIGSLGPYKKK